MKALVKVSILKNEGRYLLNEIQGLNEGARVIGDYDEVSGAVDFKFNGLDSVLWVGVNCEVVAVLGVDYVVADSSSLVAASSSEDIFDTLEKANEYKAVNGGFVFVGSYWFDLNTLDNVTGTIYAKSEALSIKRSCKYILK